MRLAAIVAALLLAASTSWAGTYTFATLPGAPTNGDTHWITDGCGPEVYGEPATGSCPGSTHLVTWVDASAAWVFVMAQGSPPPPVIDGSNLPNILLVVLDDVSSDQTPINGSFPHWPTMDLIAADGVRFSSAYGSQVCSPARWAMMTGRMPDDTMVGSAISTNNPYGPPASTVGLPELLGPVGYATASIGKNHMAPLTQLAIDAGSDPLMALYPWQFGFDYHEGLVSNAAKSLATGDSGTLDYWRYEWVGPDGTATIKDSGLYLDTHITNRALSWIAEQGENPWFLYLGYQGVHNPLTQPPVTHRTITDAGGTPCSAPPVGNNSTVCRRAMEEATDFEFARVRAAVATITRPTVVLIIGDNGTTNASRDTHTTKGKATPYFAGLNVPLWVYGPDAFVADSLDGTDIQAGVMGIDLFATILDLAGVTGYAGAPKSLSLAALLRGETVEHRVYAIGMGFSPTGFNPNGRQPAVDYDRGIYGEDQSESLVVRETPAGVVEEYYADGDPTQLTPLLPAELLGATRTTYETMHAVMIAMETAPGGANADWLDSARGVAGRSGGLGHQLALDALREERILQTTTVSATWPALGGGQNFCLNRAGGAGVIGTAGAIDPVTAGGCITAFSQSITGVDRFRCAPLWNLVGWSSGERVTFGLYAYTGDPASPTKTAKLATVLMTGGEVSAGEWVEGTVAQQGIAAAAGGVVWVGFETADLAGSAPGVTTFAWQCESVYRELR